MIKSTTLARRGFKAVFIQLKSVRSISMQETKVRLERMAEYRKNKEKEPLPPPKTEKLSAMERARDSLAFAIQTKNSEQARLQFDLLKKNLHFLTTTDCLSYLEFLAQSAKLDEITVKNAALLLSHVIERGQKGVRTASCSYLDYSASGNYLFRPSRTCFSSGRPWIREFCKISDSE